MYDAKTHKFCSTSCLDPFLHAFFFLSFLTQTSTKPSYFFDNQPETKTKAFIVK